MRSRTRRIFLGTQAVDFAASSKHKDLAAVVTFNCQFNCIATGNEMEEQQAAKPGQAHQRSGLCIGHRLLRCRTVGLGRKSGLTPQRSCRQA